MQASSLDDDMVVTGSEVRGSQGLLLRRRVAAGASHSKEGLPRGKLGSSGGVSLDLIALCAVRWGHPTAEW